LVQMRTNILRRVRKGETALGGLVESG